LEGTLGVTCGTLEPFQLFRYLLTISSTLHT
jgi:hypothetical protein